LIRKRDILNTKQFFSNFIVINVLLFFVFLLIPDLGTLLILSMVALVMSWYSGEKIKYILIMVGGALITALLA
jgi:cell division protein FtsW (lipid II flippase)